MIHAIQSVARQFREAHEGAHPTGAAAVFAILCATVIAALMIGAGIMEAVTIFNAWRLA